MEDRKFYLLASNSMTLHAAYDFFEIVISQTIILYLLQGPKKSYVACNCTVALGLVCCESCITFVVLLCWNLEVH